MRKKKIKAIRATATILNLKVRVEVPVRGTESITAITSMVEDAQIKYLQDNAKALLRDASHDIELIKDEDSGD